MARFVFRTSRALIDLIALGCAFWFAVEMRFDWAPPEPIFDRAVGVWPYVVAFQYSLLSAYGVTNFSWRYISLREMPTILAAIATGIFCMLVARITIAGMAPSSLLYRYTVIPFGIIFLDLVFAFLAISGVRIVRRLWVEHRDGATEGPPADILPTLLIGAGRAGVAVAKDLSSRPELGIEALGFLDDDTSKHGSIIHGVRVLGGTHQISAFTRRYTVRQALIAMPGVDSKTIRRIALACDAVGLRVKIIPGLSELMGGEMNLSRIRDVVIEDLLGRDAVELDVAAVASFIQDKVVLVSGAGGSIGSELCRQIARFSPVKLVMLDRFENTLFDSHRRVLKEFADVKLVPAVGDVTDEFRVRRLIQHHRPDVIFHAAAHKHVPMMESNPGEALKNNVFGTKTLADVATDENVSNFVMVSTDKAVNPTSIMGATKRVAELYIQGLGAQEGTRTTFSAVRFGNVLGSSGSVIPVFKEQIAAGGPVTVTHPEMQRYFMTIHEASQLVMQAGALGEGGEVFVLDMGAPVKIVDLASDLIRFSGLQPGVDITIEFVGIRPGEKLFEELATDDERAVSTLHEKIFIGRTLVADFDAVTRGITRLEKHVNSLDRDAIRGLLREIIPEFDTTDEGAMDNVVPMPANPTAG